MLAGTSSPPMRDHRNTEGINCFFEHDIDAGHAPVLGTVSKDLPDSRDSGVNIDLWILSNIGDTIGAGLCWIQTDKPTNLSDVELNIGIGMPASADFIL